MKVVQINATCGIGSTGKICVEISKLLTEQCIENYILYSSRTNGYSLGIKCASRIYTMFQSLKSHLLGNYGFNSRKETQGLIERLEEINPDIIHLHNIHGHDCNLQMLFNYFKSSHRKIIWTFHDCWAFTGYCTHFSMIDCNKWKKGCNACSQFRKYSFFFDRSNELYIKKKILFSGLDMVIVTPSKWLSEKVKESFLKEYPIKVIANGIDTTIFSKKTSDFKNQYNIAEQKQILLGVAYDWNFGKGLDVFIELAKRLDINKYQIVLVGTNKKVEKKLPRNVIAIRRTYNQDELAQIYSAADIFINPTREDTFPTVNMEAIACGTPVVTFNTGGSPEIVKSGYGLIVEDNKYETLEKAVLNYSKQMEEDSKNCLIYGKSLDKGKRYEEYLNLYKDCYE